MTYSLIPPEIMEEMLAEKRRAVEHMARVSASLASAQPNADGTFTFRYHKPTPSGDTVVGEVVSVKEEPL